MEDLQSAGLMLLLLFELTHPHTQIVFLAGPQPWTACEQETEMEGRMENIVFLWDHDYSVLRMDVAAFLLLT